MQIAMLLAHQCTTLTYGKHTRIMLYEQMYKLVQTVKKHQKKKIMSYYC